MQEKYNIQIYTSNMDYLTNPTLHSNCNEIAHFE
jgi:hypothetical protein